MQACQEMTKADEAAEQAGAVDVLAKDGNASLAGQAAGIPVLAGCIVELRRNEEIIGLDVAGIIMAGEEADDIRMARKMAERGELQAVQRHVMPVEIDHIDALGGCREIGEHVAAARSDGDDMMFWAQLHRCHIDGRILPDLRVDEAGEEQAEQTFRQAFQTQRLVLDQRGFQLAVPFAVACIGVRDRSCLPAIR